MSCRPHPTENQLGEESPIETLEREASEQLASSDLNRRLGFFYCFFADLLYSLSFFFVRCLTEYRELSTDWTLFIKEIVTVILVFPFIAIPALGGRYRFPSWKTFGLLLLAGFFCEFFGARLNLWAYAMLGLVLALPLIQTFMLLETLVFGRIILREKIGLRKIIISILLIVAVFMLAFSRSSLTSDFTNTIFSKNILSGVLVTFIAGTGYALFYILLRKVLKKDPNNPTAEPVPPTLVLFTVCSVGTAVAGICLLLNRGPAAFLSPTPQCWILALSAGLVNCIAFFLKSIGLRYATASKVAFIAVVQIVCLSILGATFFQEETNALIWGGLTLTCIGIICSRRQD